MLPLLDYGVVQLLSRYSVTNLSKIERQYKMALKSAAQLPKRISTEALWAMADIEACTVPAPLCPRVFSAFETMSDNGVARGRRWGRPAPGATHLEVTPEITRS
ncbi:hypothetical protein EVAR_89606_1 [Eumeta japonica]|uniref:Uncharacterized protein n=1 Tax=Eumeta variegata TaxID=151549 RepID=A0A4C1XN50_EUMVA|nr:hypothetical protein EVAR_89606_1 [Eumeta japonica]